jgi:hypothetical protein
LETFGTCLAGRTGDEIFDLVDKFLETNGLLWSNYVGISSDYITTLTGRKRGFTIRVKGVAARVIFQYCMIRKKLQSDIKGVL